MISGLIGRKIGMTQIFDEEGNVFPVTVVEAGPCYVLELKESPLKIKLGFQVAKESRVNKPQLGLFKKAGVSALSFVRELPSSDNKDYKLGQEIKADVFKAGDFVDITGISIGKGFAGGMKRWHWKGGPGSHGSTSHRRVGSIGSNTTPGRVWKGHHMPGRLGNAQVTTQNLRVMQVDLENNLLLIKGAVPGHKNNFIVVKRALKKKFQALDQKQEVVKAKRNPMKQSKAKVKGKA